MPKQPSIQDLLADSSSVRKPRKVGTPGNDENWPSRQWLRWFLDNYSTTELIPLGVWKKGKFIVQDYGENDELVGAMRAAFLLEGKQGALAILAAQLVSELPEGTPLPELPADWDARVRYRYEEYRDPETRPQLWGVRKSDSDR